MYMTVRAQADVGIKENFAGGEVAAVSDAKIVLKTKDGDIDAVLTGTTVFKRVPPEKLTLKAAVDSNFSEIGIGDKILVSGLVSTDKKTIPAKTIYLITKSDIAERNARELQEWKTRGISGKVVAVNRLSKEITVSVPNLIGATQTVITPKEDIRYKRYAPDSREFSEALDSSLGEINPGDMLRALGDKGENNTFKAEVILTGAFQTTIGKVTAIDAEKNEVMVKDSKTEKPITIFVGKARIFKEFPAEMAQRMAMMQMAQAGGQMVSGQPGGQGGNRPQQGVDGRRPPEGQPGGTGPGGGGMRGGSIDDMLERFPNITIADLKIGDSIAVSSSKTTDADRITAIKLLSGIEPFLKVPQRPAGRGGQPGGGQNTGISIPGLDDGFGIP